MRLSRTHTCMIDHYPIMLWATHCVVHILDHSVVFLLLLLSPDLVQPLDQLWILHTSTEQ